MKKITLTQNKKTIIDDDMFDYLNQFKWHAAKDGRRFYASKNHRFNKKEKWKTLKMHNVIAGYPLNKMHVDHINGDGLDNRRVNLRIVSHRENKGNSLNRINGKTYSKYPGVTFDKTKNTWMARITINYKQKFLGRYKKEEAADSYNKAKSLL